MSEIDESIALTINCNSNKLDIDTSKKEQGTVFENLAISRYNCVGIYFPPDIDSEINITLTNIVTDGTTPHEDVTIKYIPPKELTNMESNALMTAKSIKELTDKFVKKSDFSITNEIEHDGNVLVTEAAVLNFCDTRFVFQSKILETLPDNLSQIDDDALLPFSLLKRYVEAKINEALAVKNPNE